MCYKFTEKTDIHKEDRKKEKTEHWCILASRMNSGYSSYQATLPRYCRNTYIEPQYSRVKLSGTHSKDVKESNTSVIFSCFLGTSLISYSFWSISHLEQILNPGRSRRNHSRVWRKYHGIVA